MGFNCYPRSGIRQNLPRTRMRTGKENDIRDSNESSLAGCGIIVKKGGMRDQDPPFQILRLQRDYLNRDTFMEFNRLRADSSLSFPSDLVRRVHARATRNEGGSPRRKKSGLSFVVPLPSRAFSHARGHLRVSGVFPDRQTKKRDCSWSRNSKDPEIFLT